MKIEKHIPIPPPSLNSEMRGLTEALNTMQVGDSIHLLRDDTKLSCYYSRIPNKKFTGRKTTSGVRVWRIE